MNLKIFVVFGLIQLKIKVPSSVMMHIWVLVYVCLTKMVELRVKFAGKYEILLQLLMKDDDKKNFDHKFQNSMIPFRDITLKEHSNGTTWSAREWVEKFQVTSIFF